MNDNRVTLECENKFSFSQGKSGLLSSNKITNFSMTPSPKKVFDEDTREYLDYENSTSSQSTQGKTFSFSSKSNILLQKDLLLDSSKTMTQIEIHKKKIRECENSLKDLSSAVQSAKNIPSVKRDEIQEVNKLVHSQKKVFREDEDKMKKKINEFVLSPEEAKTSPSQADLKSLTNTQDIRDFREYTWECMQSINKVQLSDKEPRKVDLEASLLQLFLEGDKKLAVFDLDETLVHREVEGLSDCDEVIQVTMPNKTVAKIGINIRPLLRESLLQISRDYILVLFTASQQIYADKVLELIDPKQEFFVKRLYRDSCRTATLEGETIYVKDLEVFRNVPKEKIVIIDNSVLSFCSHLYNGIPILPFYDNKADTELKDLVGYLDYLKNVDDIRAENKHTIGLADYYPISEFNSSSSDDNFQLVAEKENDQAAYGTNSSHDGYFASKMNYGTNSSLSEADYRSNDKQAERHQDLFKCLEVFQKKYQKLKMKENQS